MQTLNFTGAPHFTTSSKVWWSGLSALGTKTLGYEIQKTIIQKKHSGHRLWIANATIIIFSLFCTSMLSDSIKLSRQRVGYGDDPSQFKVHTDERTQRAVFPGGHPFKYYKRSTFLSSVNKPHSWSCDTLHNNDLCDGGYWLYLRCGIYFSERRHSRSKQCWPSVTPSGRTVIEADGHVMRPTRIAHISSDSYSSQFVVCKQFVYWNHSTSVWASMQASILSEYQMMSLVALWLLASLIHCMSPGVSTITAI